MPIAVERTVQAIGAVVQTVPVGTNIALLHLLWVMLNGSFLRSRGAVFGGTGWAKVYAAGSAAQLGGFAQREMGGRRAVDNWQLYVASENRWRVPGMKGLKL